MLELVGGVVGAIGTFAKLKLLKSGRKYHEEALELQREILAEWSLPYDQRDLPKIEQKYKELSLLVGLVNHEAAQAGSGNTSGN